MFADGEERPHSDRGRHRRQRQDDHHAVHRHILRATGRKVGMTCTDGIFIDGRRIDSGDCSGPAAPRSVLLNPPVDAAVLETARGGILRAGLGFDRATWPS